MGEFEKDVNLSLKQPHEFDLNGKRINKFGYLIDERGNIVDVYNGNIVFKKEILDQTKENEGQIPKVFREGKLRIPPMAMTNVEEIKPKKKNKKPARPLVDQEMDIDEEEIFKELEKLDFGLVTQEEMMPPLRDVFMLDLHKAQGSENLQKMESAIE